MYKPMYKIICIKIRLIKLHQNQLFHQFGGNSLE